MCIRLELSIELIFYETLEQGFASTLCTLIQVYQLQASSMKSIVPIKRLQ